jgi:hypothetical protein
MVTKPKGGRFVLEQKGLGGRVAFVFLVSNAGLISTLHEADQST